MPGHDANRIAGGGCLQNGEVINIQCLELERGISNIVILEVVPTPPPKLIL